LASFIQFDSDEKRTYIQQAATILKGRNPVIVEKDFWVSWMLELLFKMPEMADSLVFKGGTSLSKVYNAIKRFSEDIDLSIMPSLLGTDEEYLEEAPTKKQSKKRSNALKRQCTEFVKGEMLSLLQKRVIDVLGDDNWVEFHEGNPPFLAFKYTTVLTGSDSYLTPYVKLEFSSLTDQQPVGRHQIQSMISEAFPGAIDEGHARVTVLDVERTFWEKATILHAEFHRSEDEIMPDRYARHFADLANLCRHEAKTLALARPDLLERVAYHKERFFRAAWARYDLARPGSLHLIPPDFRMDEIRKDYIAMQDMYYGTPFTFDEVCYELKILENEINNFE